MPRPTLELKGRRFGRLVVLERFPCKGSARWWCVCDCGENKVIPATMLLRGLARSCGCLRKEATRRLFTTHGDASGGRCTVEYNVWATMLARCVNVKVRSYPNYGGRGIRVCARWQSFANFLADMGRRPSAKHSINRVNNDGDYTPENCRWATAAEQANNTRCSRWLVHRGARATLTQHARRAGLRVGTVWYRLQRGWSVQRALTTKVS